MKSLRRKKYEIVIGEGGRVSFLEQYNRVAKDLQLNMALQHTIYLHMQVTIFNETKDSFNCVGYTLRT